MRFILAATVSVAAALVLSAPATAAPAGTTRARVVHVDDGDTIEVRIHGRPERVRYIGIDAPEVAHNGEGGEPDGEAATAVNRALVGGRLVGLELDAEPRDGYGRLLAYVWRGDVMINLEMVRRGYARALTIPPNLRYERWFRAAETEARAARRGLWGSAGLARTENAGVGGLAEAGPSRESSRGRSATRPRAVARERIACVRGAHHASDRAALAHSTDRVPRPSLSSTTARVPSRTSVVSAHTSCDRLTRTRPPADAVDEARRHR